MEIMHVKVALILPIAGDCFAADIFCIHFLNMWWPVYRHALLVHTWENVRHVHTLVKYRVHGNNGCNFVGAKH